MSSQSLKWTLKTIITFGGKKNFFFEKKNKTKTKTKKKHIHTKKNNNIKLRTTRKTKPIMDHYIMNEQMGINLGSRFYYNLSQQLSSRLYWMGSQHHLAKINTTCSDKETQNEISSLKTSGMFRTSSFSEN